MTTELIKMLILDLLARMDRKDPQVSYISKPLSVLDAFRFYNCSGYLTHWCEAAIELHVDRWAHGESRNGMIYLELSESGLSTTGETGAGGFTGSGRAKGTCPELYPADKSVEYPAFVNSQPRTIQQLACTQAAKEMYERAIQAAELYARQPDTDTENTMHRGSTFSDLEQAVERAERNICQPKN